MSLYYDDKRDENDENIVLLLIFRQMAGKPKPPPRRVASAADVGQLLKTPPNCLVLSNCSHPAQHQTQWEIVLLNVHQ
jgi:hypothetical protein